jgi:hypothetical protein
MEAPVALTEGNLLAREAAMTRVPQVAHSGSSAVRARARHFLCNHGGIESD